MEEAAAEAEVLAEASVVGLAAAEEAAAETALVEDEVVEPVVTSMAFSFENGVLHCVAPVTL